MYMDKVNAVNRFWSRNYEGITTRVRGDIPGILKAQDVFVFGEDFSDDKGTVRTFMRITNPSKPYVRAYD
jgi:hypothetical protein